MLYNGNASSTVSHIFEYLIERNNNCYIYSEPADPALITIPPIEQYGADYTFSTPKYSYGEYKNFFMFIVKEAEASGLKLNGANMATLNVRSIPNTDYVGGYVIVSNCLHTMWRYCNFPLRDLVVYIDSLVISLTFISFVCQFVYKQMHLLNS